MRVVSDKGLKAGLALTVTDLVAVAVRQPPVPATVYVIVVVPGAIPVTTPVDELTLAIELFKEDQIPAADVEVKFDVDPTQIDCVPLNVPAIGGGVTVIRTLSVQVVTPSLTVT